MIAGHATAMLALLLLWGPAALFPARPGPDHRPWGDYEVLVERNIFSRVRGPELTRPDQALRREAPPPERFVFLRGIVRRDGEFIAVLEDMGSGRTMRVRPGDAVLDGRVAGVTLDGIIYVGAGEEEISVSVGTNLEKVSPEASATGLESATPAAPAGDSDGDEAQDVLERLRQRRLRELER
ncbi:MAG: hypothetical protein PVJ27_02730 [Candidatus Brocadiaceae bacterium]|jgi:hypothetical protein